MGPEAGTAGAAGRFLNFDKNATDLGSALDFVRSRLTWQKFKESAEDYRSKRRPPVQPADEEHDHNTSPL